MTAKTVCVFLVSFAMTYLILDSVKREMVTEQFDPHMDEPSSLVGEDISDLIGMGLDGHVYNYDSNENQLVVFVSGPSCSNIQLVQLRSIQKLKSEFPEMTVKAYYLNPIASPEERIFEAGVIARATGISFPIFAAVSGTIIEKMSSQRFPLVMLAEGNRAIAVAGTDVDAKTQALFDLNLARYK